MWYTPLNRTVLVLAVGLIMLIATANKAEVAVLTHHPTTIMPLVERRLHTVESYLHKVRRTRRIIQTTFLPAVERRLHAFESYVDHVRWYKLTAAGSRPKHAHPESLKESGEDTVVEW